MTAAHAPLHDLTVRLEWLRAVGLAILAVSTAFTIWARLALGTMWTFDPVLLGGTLLDGVGRWIVLVPVGLVVLGIKLRQEERLMLATFPVDYPAYRRRVPALLPRPRRRRATSARPSPSG